MKLLLYIISTLLQFSSYYLGYRTYKLIKTEKYLESEIYFSLHFLFFIASLIVFFTAISY